MVMHNNITNFRMYIMHLIFIYMWLILLLTIGTVVANQTNVTCTGGLCTNNTCEYGFYNTTINCLPCNRLKHQYKIEKCCSVYTTSSPYRAIPIENKIYENDTGTVQVVSTPPREICHHLWVEYGNCPPICNALLPGEFCSMNIDCKDTSSCKGFCCVMSDVNCHSCANYTGFCDRCTNGMGFNATGNLTCGKCPSWTYLTNNTCHRFTNCTSGFYPIFDGNETMNRVCESTPNGYYTNGTNQQPILWSICNNESYAVGGNTQDVTCLNKTVCVQGSYVVEEVSDRVCSECIDGFSNTSNQAECHNYTACTIYQSNGTNTSDTICN